MVQFPLLTWGTFFGAQNETVTIDGVDFNIPNGYKEDTSGTADKMLDHLKEQGAEIASKVYIKDNTAVALAVMNVTNGLSNKQALELLVETKLQLIM